MDSLVRLDVDGGGGGTFYNLAATVGLIVTPFFAFKLLLSTYRAFQLYVWSQHFAHQDTLKYGKWAVVTGATDGIGQSMAKEFARRGHSVVVVGRSEEKLANTRKMLESVPEVGQVETIKIDLSDSSMENYAPVVRQLDADNRDIGILVNNAGVASEVWMEYHDYDLDYIRRQVNVNVLSGAYFTNMVLPGMLKRHTGLIMNISSVYGGSPLGHVCLYGPTKTFVNTFSRVLQFEYQSDFIDIVNLTPGSVATKMMAPFAFTSWSFLMPSSDTFARSAINAARAKVSSYCGCFGHEFVKQPMDWLDYFGILSPCYALMSSLFVATKVKSRAELVKAGKLL